MLPQKLATDLPYRYTYVDKSQGYVLLAVVHYQYSSYLRGYRYLYKVIISSLAFQPTHVLLCTSPYL